MSHARIAPSGAYRWLNCPGSISMCDPFPDVAGEAAAEGTASHFVGSEILSGRPQPAPGQKDPDGTVITMEMIEGAWVYVQEVSKVAKSPIYVEHKLTIPRVHETCHGTCDLWHQEAYEIHIWDYKFGFGVVNPVENWQLICYGAGVLDFLKIDGILDQHYTMVFHIVQPRGFHRLGPHREWRIGAADLRGYINRLAHAASVALLPEAPITSGDHCKYCNARHVCVAAQQAAMFGIEYTDTAHSENLSPDALAIELRTLQRAAQAIKYRLTGLEQQAISCIQSGGMVPGFAVDRGTGRVKWVRPAAEVFALGDLMGVDLRAEPDAITPAAARRAGIPEELISSFSRADESGVKLVPTDNSLASLIFKAAP